MEVDRGNLSMFESRRGGISLKEERKQRLKKKSVEQGLNKVQGKN